ncbi:hypothetical protein HGO37_11695 [Rhizobium sp. CG4]|jgi:hypothetical protein|uniref:hypothetical protein n=1 Tax=Rhizobium sp. CG4 TaxID=2726075 RepID=UPI002033802E|nr:hypothetical protein [Rhizobium sp. CG4]MCM2456047.1 hypothetical protein [Rhizobium sp. CG4]
MSQSYQLTEADAAQIWVRHWKGEYQHVIAATFGVNQGRVNEVLKGHRHPGSKDIARQINDAN